MTTSAIRVFGLWLSLMAIGLSPAVGVAQFRLATNSDQTITIVRYTGTGASVAIPAMTNGLPVTSIGRLAFYYSNVTNVAIPDSVSSIADSAFYFCTRLASIAIPNGVTNIAAFAFTGCTGMTSITVQAGNACYSSLDGVLLNRDSTVLIQCPIGKGGRYLVPASVGSIESPAFNSNVSLTDISIPKNTSNIVYSAFFGCTNLANIVVDLDNPWYSSLAGVLFNRTQETLVTCPGGKVGAYTIPSSVTNIGVYGFGLCSSLTDIAIPETVSAIGEYAFYNCASLGSIRIPGTVSRIGDATFCGCSSLTSILIPDSVTFIGSSAFIDCTSLRDVRIPAAVAEIIDYTFWGCSSLTSITFPEGLAAIDDYAFYFCSNLASITVPSTAVQNSAHSAG